MQQGQQSGQAQTGTRDETYDVIAVLYHALQGAENCQVYSQDASRDEELRSFFEQAANQQRQLADQAKQLLQRSLQHEGGQSGSAFFGQQGQTSGQGTQQTEGSFTGQTGGGGTGAGF